MLRLASLFPLFLVACATLTPPQVYPLLPLGYEAQARLSTAANQNYMVAISQGGDAATVALLTAQGAPIYTLQVESRSYSAKRYLPLEGSLTPDKVLQYLAVIYRSGENTEWNTEGGVWQLKDSFTGQEVELELLEWAHVLPE